MITFQKIRWKNFLSTGDHFTEVDFRKNATNLIVGTNGTGKSTVLDALTFSLFNKPFRKINKSQLINSTNERGCLVEVEFCINNKEYRVLRGIKPNVFDIIVDGTPMHKEADDRIMQKMLEENILKLNYKSFTQIVILGSSAFVPFMQLSGSNRREVIEDLLDIRIFSAMNSLLRERLKVQKDEILTLDLSKDNVKDKVEMQETFIKELETRGKQRIQEKEGKINLLEGEIQETSDETECLMKDVEMFNNDLENFTGANKKLKKLNTLKGQITQKVATITKEHKFFTDNTVCPTCTQDIEEEFRVNRIADVQDKAKELKKGFKDLEETIKLETERERHFTQLSKEITKLNHDISQNNTRISLSQRQIGELEDEVQTITERFENRNTEHEKLAKLSEQLNTTFESLGEEKDDIQYKDYVYNLLRDGGVKRKIIKKYLPLINKQVNRYLQMMDFYINFTLDEEFNEKVQSPIHEDFCYASFSEGEKMRIDLALLFTWREVAAYKNSTNTNLLIMDEVFDSSLDGSGTDEFLKIIRFVVKNANIFVISHKESLLEKFESVIQFEKIKGFSRIVS